MAYATQPSDIAAKTADATNVAQIAAMVSTVYATQIAVATPLCAAAIACATPAQWKNDAALVCLSESRSGEDETDLERSVSDDTDASSELSDEDEQPTLKRVDTFTEYNERLELEWCGCAAPCMTQQDFTSAAVQGEEAARGMTAPVSEPILPGQVVIPQASQFSWIPWTPTMHVDLIAQPLMERVNSLRAPELQQAPKKLQQDHLIEVVEQAQLQAETRAVQEASQLHRRRGSKYVDGMSRVSFAAHVNVLSEALDAGGVALAEALAAIGGMCVQMAHDAQGCRVLQYALEIADLRIAAELSAGLRGHVPELVNSPHGNYVIQKLIEVLPLSQASFVAEELVGNGASTARHRFGCRILCRLLEHSAGETLRDHALKMLFSEVIADTIDLSRHKFGHHVVKSILEHGKPAQRDVVIDKICRDIPRNLRSRNAHFVIETILTECAFEERRVVLDRLAAGGSEVRTALAHGGGSGVRINRLLKNYLSEWA